MKKIVFILTIILIMITGCSNKLETYKKIDYAEFIKMFENKESFILYIGSSECSHCASYTLKLNRVIKTHQVMVYYIDVAKMSESEHNKFEGKIKYNGTPTTVFINKGKEDSTYNRIDGNQNYDKIVDKFKKNNYIE